MPEGTAAGVARTRERRGSDAKATGPTPGPSIAAISLRAQATGGGAG